MKILTFAHRLELGGTQVNAIELAAALRDIHGFSVTLFATPGPALELAIKKRLAFIPAPDSRYHPSPARMRALHDAIRSEKPDLVHAWDWWQGLEAYYAAYLPMRQATAVSDMMMEPTRVLPREIPTTFGTPNSYRRAVSRGWKRAALLVPPIDALANSPSAAKGARFRAEHRVGKEEIAIVSVSRLSGEMKTEPLFQAIQTIRRLGSEIPLKLFIVGDGTSRGALENLAGQVNLALGRSAVVLTGPLADPRPAYAAADVVLGMGGSSLRAMAFEKPVIIVGHGGFAEAFEADSAYRFYDQGMFGWGREGSQSRSLDVALERLATDAHLRDSAGRFGRAYVHRFHSLETVSERLAEFCVFAASSPSQCSRNARDAVRTTLVYLRERRFLCASRDPHRREARS